MPLKDQNWLAHVKDIVRGKHLLEIQTANRNAQEDITREERKKIREKV